MAREAAIAVPDEFAFTYSTGPVSYLRNFAVVGVFPQRVAVKPEV